jgi:hypothetical protein
MITRVIDTDLPLVIQILHCIIGIITVTIDQSCRMTCIVWHSPLSWLISWLVYQQLWLPDFKGFDEIQ